MVICDGELMWAHQLISRIGRWWQGFDFSYKDLNVDKMILRLQQGKGIDMKDWIWYWIWLVCKFGQIVDMKLLHIGCGFPMFGAVLTAAQHWKSVANWLIRSFCTLDVVSQCLVQLWLLHNTVKSVANWLIRSFCTLDVVSQCLVKFWLLNSTVKSVEIDWYEALIYKLDVGGFSERIALVCFIQKIILFRR